MSKNSNWLYMPSRTHVGGRIILFIFFLIWFLKLVGWLVVFPQERIGPGKSVFCLCSKNSLGMGGRKCFNAVNLS